MCSGRRSRVAGNDVSWDELVDAHRARARLRRHGAEERRCRRRRHEPAHRRGPLAQRAARGAEFHLISPLRDDLPAEVEARLAPDPARHRRRADARPRAHAGHRGPARPRLSRPLLRRLREVRGLPARPQRRPAERRRLGGARSAASPAEDIVALARRAAGRRTLVTCSQSLQRAEHGEQPVWMGLVLAAMLGQIGLPGGGFAYALGSIAEHRQAAARRAVADAAAGPQQRRRFHPGGAHRRHAAASRRGVRLRRPAADLPRHPAGVLGGRQSVPSPPGSAPAARGLRAARTR